MQISFYKDTFSKDYVDIAHETIIKGIREGHWKDRVEALRSMDEKTYKQEKTKLPAVTWSGTFTERLDKSLVKYSGYVVLDVDNLDAETIVSLRDQFCDNEYVYCAFVSPSGSGFKIVVKVNTGPEHHLAAFLHLQKTFQDKYLIKVDDSGKNLSRLCYISFDHALVFQEKAKVFEVDTRYAEVKTYSQNDKLKNYSTSTDTNHAFSVCRKWVDNTIPYNSGQRNRHVHAMACALNRCGVSVADAEHLLKSEYTDLEEKEIHGCVKSAYFHNSHEHGSVEVKDMNGAEKFTAPPYIANYTDDVVINDIMQTTALLFHHKVPMKEIGRIISKLAKCYKLEGFIDIDRATLGDVMNKSLQVLNTNIVEQTLSNSLNYVSAAELGAELINMGSSERVVPTHIEPFDKALGGGIMPGNFYGIIGVGETYKSVIAQFISVATASVKKGVLYLSGEMSKMQFYERLAAMCLHIKLMERLRKGEINVGNIQQVIDEINTVLNNCLFLVSETGYNYTNILATIANIEAKSGIKIELVVIDGVTQMSSDGLQEIPAAIKNTEVCKQIAKNAHDGAGVVVLGLMHISGDQLEAKSRIDNGPFCRGGGKTIANFDGYFSTSLIPVPGMREVGSTDMAYEPGKVRVMLADKRSGAGRTTATLAVSEFLQLTVIG